MAAAEERKTERTRNVAIFMIGAVICAGAAGVMMARVISKRYPHEPLRPIVVLNRDFEAGKPFSSADLRLAEWPVSAIPRGAFSTAAEALREKWVPLIPLGEGAPLLTSQLSKSGAGLGVAAKLHRGQRAMAVSTELSLALAKLLYPGARVDLITTVNRSPGGGPLTFGNAVTKVFLQNVQVLAVGEYMDPLSAGARDRRRGSAKRVGSRSASKRDRQAARRIVTLAVTPEESERLTLALRQGHLDFSLRSLKDEARVTTEGATRQSLLGEGRFPESLNEQRKER